MPRDCGHDYFRRDCSCSRLVREAWLFLLTVDGAGCITAVVFRGFEASRLLSRYFLCWSYVMLSIQVCVEADYI